LHCCSALRGKKGLNATPGFTLVEAMVVVAILAIVVALAYPSYLEQIRKARRADAESSLLAAAQLLERCFTRINSYLVSDEGCPDPTGASQDGFYTISFADGSPTATTYTLVATPQGDQANDPCNEYTVDHLGNKTPVPGGHRCWGVASS
jgi:type IV pilus assembly protein PilE